MSGYRREPEREDVDEEFVTVARPLDEVEASLLEQALTESERCFSCGTCTHCDNCVVYCPDMAVKRVDNGYAVLTDYCKGCGLCVKECPTGSMTMQEELR